MSAHAAINARSAIPAQAGAQSAASGAASWAGLLLVALQCAVIAVLIDRFRLENNLFRLTTKIALCGFVVHHFLPMRLRLRFFVALSLGTIGYCLGLVEGNWNAPAALQRAGALGAVGLGLMGICHLPLRFPWRVALLLAAGGGLAFFRAGVLKVAVLDDIWPVLGAMFMFRVMVYLYDLDTMKERPPLSRSLAYFFLFPNLWLYVFPVIDFKTFGKNYFNDQPLAIYQKGLHWMMRGITHLLVWRFLYYQVYLDPATISDGAQLVQFLFANIGLYLRIIGQFHFVIGLLHLFGFNLPETNRRLFLASSFTDYWRRANIYWKDFMIKVFYYPSIVRLKSWGPLGSVAGATGAAFVVTWLLHPYQWFWLRGAFPLPARDVVFWGALGVLVCVNSLLEMRGGRERTLGTRALTWNGAYRRALATGGTFITVTILWSLWTCDTLEQWVDIWETADRFTLLYGVAGVLLVMALAMAEYFGWDDPFGLAAKPAKAMAAKANAVSPLFWRQAVGLFLIPAAGLYFISSYRVMSKMPPELKEMARSLSRVTPNKSGEEFLVRGYYESLDAGRVGAVGNDVIAGRPASWLLLEQTPLVKTTQDLRTTALNPSMELVVNGKRIRTNQWGMRDREYTLEKPEGVYRIALLGSSIVMGWNVNQEEVFDNLVEDRMNRELAPGRFEILNFSANGYSVVSLWEQLQEKALAFKPDAVMLVSHPEDPGRARMIFSRSLTMGVIPKDPDLEKIRVAAGITRNTPRSVAERELAPYPLELVKLSYRRIAALCRDNGIRPIYVYLPGVLTQGADERGDKLIPLAREAGFEVISLSGVYASVEDRSTLMVAPWDAHPTAGGHRMIADRLFKELASRRLQSSSSIPPLKFPRGE